jgi:threonine dehydratase
MRRMIRQARERIGPHIVTTPLHPSPPLSRMTGGHVFLKLENVQVTGSFKIRGAANKILSLAPRQLKKGLVTASSGNHGRAFAYMLTRLNQAGIVFLPKGASPVKIRALRSPVIDLRFHGDDCVETERYAREWAARTGRIYVPPYNDQQVIAGQGTVGLEIEKQVRNADAVFAPIGGGGLISGVSAWMKASSGAFIIGCQPENSPVMARSVEAGKILELPSLATISDGSAGGIESGSITFEFCRALVDRFILVSEEEIRNAIRFLVSEHGLATEGAGALTVAALMREKNRFQGKNVVLVISGSRIDPDLLKEIL